MRTEKELADIYKRIAEIDEIISPLKEERRLLRRRVSYIEHYERTHGKVDRHYKTPEEVREYYRIKQRECRARKKERSND